MADGAQGRVDFGVRTVLHGNQDMGPQKIGLHIEAVLARHSLPARKAHEALDEKLFGFHPFRTIGKDAQGKIALPFHNLPKHGFPA
ncbi:hypothetical protein GCM10011505_46190 [Tistrella bauzanensis]|uniref:Uncharacterized protein n=1 Tax=Tistrella bauzanensis TaxID=657419 RepID=A0ABQ1J8A3_9PROT|nr:hypothetical protein GCM10011505_46190 [Tistrella bauzanensis]